MRSTTLSCLLVALLLGSERDAHADVPDLSAAQDEVVLKNGGMLRGTVIDEERDKHVVVIVYGTNEERVVPWSSVERVERNRHSTSPPSAPPDAPVEAPEPAPTPGPPPGYGGVVKVHIVSTEPDAPEVHLYRWTGNTAWLSPTDQTEFSDRGRTSMGTQSYGPPLGELMCKLPCGVLVDGSRGHEFVLSGPGITDSAPFQLLGWRGEVTLRVNPGSFKVHGWGVRMLERRTILVPIVAGATLVGFSFAAPEPPLPFNKPLFITGSAFSALAMFIPLTGFLLTLAGGTTYEVVPHKTATALVPQLTRDGLVWQF